MNSRIVPLIGLALLVACPASAAARPERPPAYEQVQRRLQHGWNTWDSRSVLRHVRLPEGLAVNLSFKRQRWLNEPYLDRALIGERRDGAPRVRPGLHAHDGHYTELTLEWEGLSARIRSARVDDGLLLRVEPLAGVDSPVKMVVSLGLLWNRPGRLTRCGDNLVAEVAGREVRFHVDGDRDEDPNVPVQTPYLVVRLDRPLVVSTGRSWSPAEAEAQLDAARVAMADRARAFGDLADGLLAIESAIAWNTIYEPRHNRVVSTVGRLWNEEYGGYCLFGWDNFFLAYLSALNHRDLALANVMEHLTSQTEEGFIPNDNRGNGSRSYDRSQPPVGGLMVREVYRRFPERWLLEAAWPVLLEWNRWWVLRRENGGLLSYGSHRTANPFQEPHAATAVAAGWESGMDDSPMYEGVPFDSERGVLELQDVGLTSLYIADCRALEEMARLLGREAEARELGQRAERFAAALDGLWSAADGYYLNRRSDTGEFSRRRSPTLFYPLLTGTVPAEQVADLMGHFHHPDEFHGEWMLPSISRDDPSFPRQRYWRGAIWPPLNFLCYLGLRQAGQMAAAAELAEKSHRLFLREWRDKGLVGENYSALTGAADDPRLSSDRFHSWGALLGVMVFVEQGWLAAPERPLAGAAPASGPGSGH